MKIQIRFLYKLLAGFGIIGLTMVFIFLSATKTINETSGLIDRAVNVQVRQLAQVNRLQSQANKIRIIEAELPRITDIFAITGAVYQLDQETAAFENDLQAFVEEFFPREDEETVRLLEEWRLYVEDLARTVRQAQERNFEEAQRISTYYSRPHFQTFAQALKEASGRIEKKAQEDYRLAVRQLARKRRDFLAISLAGIGLSFAFAFLLSRSLSVRLRALRRGAMLLAGGRLEEPIPVAGKDEVADLAASFNIMRVQVQKREEDLRRAHDELERRVEERTAELAEANRELDAFVYTLSHDLRTPMSIIISTADFLQNHYRQRLDTDGLDFLADIERQSERMLALMEDLLALAKVGQVARPTAPVATGKVAEQTVEFLREQIVAAGVTVRIGPMPDLHVPETLLAQVFDNLVGNAIRYGGTPGGSIEVGGERRGERVQFFVRDHGPGISEEEQSEIFNVFSRGAAGRKLPGTGVGLATVSKIARLYGGQAWVEQTPGGGATFRVEMADLPPEDARPESSRSAGREGSGSFP